MAEASEPREHDVQASALRPSDELRQTLDRLDNLVGILRRHSPEEVAEIPALFERANALLERLKSRSKEFQAEEARLRTVQGQFDKQERAFVNKLGAARVARLRDALGDPAPPEDHWWWYMDRLAAQRRSAFLKRIGIGTAIVVVVGLVLVVVYQNFLAPDPNLMAAYSLRGQAEDLAYTGDYAAALEAIDQGLALVPDESSLLVLRGAILTVQGDTSAAQTAFDAAKTALGSEASSFLYLRAQEYIRIDEPQLALDDMNAVLDSNPASAEAYYIMGTADELLNNPSAAYQNYALAAQYATQSGNVQLEALARMQLANVSSRVLLPTAPPLPTATP